MNQKRIITILLLVFVAASVTALVAKEIFKSGSEDNTVSLVQDIPQPVVVENIIEEVKDASPEQKKKLVVYYFHGNARCVTCRKLESYAKEALVLYFSEGLSSGTMEFKPVNVEIPENDHFIKDYSLVTKSVVLSDTVNGEQTNWKNLDKIWELVGDKEIYQQYIRDNIKEFLGDQS